VELLHTTVCVYGTPKGQPRARAFARNGMVRMYDPATAEGWKGQVASAMRPYIPTEPYNVPMRLDIDFFMPRPKAHYRTGKHSDELRADAPLWFASTPDIDNLWKSVGDALTQIGFWKDDSLAVAGTITKRYCNGIVKPGAFIQFGPVV
jgi:Holliday junction resolvase RusA-like endonuclease